MAPTRKRRWTQRSDSSSESSDTDEYVGLLRSGGMSKLVEKRRKVEEEMAEEIKHRDKVVRNIDAVDEEIRCLQKRSEIGKTKAVEKQKEKKKLREKKLLEKSKEKKNLSAQKCRANNNIANYHHQLLALKLVGENWAAKKEVEEMRVTLARIEEEQRTTKGREAFLERQVIYLTKTNIQLSKILQELQQENTTSEAAICATAPPIPADMQWQSEPAEGPIFDDVDLDNNHVQ